MSELERRLRQQMGDANFEECYRSCFGRLRADRYGDFPLHEVTLRMVAAVVQMQNDIDNGDEPNITFMPFGAPVVRTPEPDSLRIIQGSGRSSTSSGGSSSSTGNTSPNSGGCYIATAVYGSYDCPQVWTLRRYRDNTLVKSWYGRIFVKLYYAISPMLVNIFGNAKWFKVLCKSPLDKLINRLQRSGVSNTVYNDKL
jgi:hypothetical protein